MDQLSIFLVALDSLAPKLSIPLQKECGVVHYFIVLKFASLAFIKGKVVSLIVITIRVNARSPRDHIRSAGKSRDGSPNLIYDRIVLVFSFGS
jgi:hypothetical protein